MRAVLCTVVEWIGLSSAPHDIGRGHLRRFHPRRTWVSGNEPLVHARTPTPTPTHPPTPPHTHIICGQSLIDPRSTPNFLATSSIANWNSGKSSFWVSSFDTPLFLLACINVSASAHATVQPAASTNRRTRSHRQTPGEKSAWRRAFLASQGRLPHPKPPRNL